MSSFNDEESLHGTSSDRSRSRLETTAGSSFEIARHLGRKLAPVVVDLGPGQPRFASYLDWDEEKETSLLVPIAGGDLSLALQGCTQPIPIRSCDVDEPWMLVAKRLRVLSDRMAMVAVRRFACQAAFRDARRPEGGNRWSWRFTRARLRSRGTSFR
jgi:hypothetical protein